MPPLVKSATALKAKLFRGFADLSRLSILEALRNGPLTVGHRRADGPLAVECLQSFTLSVRL